ncbi:Potassium channel subfamily K member 1 [Apodemus speciosus]|uniref:Potassium channel subfamily K member n=1 Tax=Apodemus speciosus TaxID=105296 RepID=A0ABQ0F427_APOSI
MLQSLAGSSCVRLVERHRSAWCFGFLVLGYLLYLVFGAVVFSSVELPYEDLLRQELRKLKRRFLEEHECLSEPQLEQFLGRVLEASNYGVSVLSNASGNWNWDFTSALFFASTVLSTTAASGREHRGVQGASGGQNCSAILNGQQAPGIHLAASGNYNAGCYGHTVPLSDGGKAFCIIYSVIGIPFTLLFLTAVVQRVTVHVTRRPVLYFHIRWGFSKQVVAIVHAVLLGFVTVSCFFFIPAAVFSVLEDDWNFLESFYFCFISLSTIGLGDYVPGEGYNQKFRELYKIGITCYLLLGLIAMLVVLETFCELHELKKFRKMFYVKKDKDEDQVHIMEHDQLSFSSITEQVAGLKEEQKQNEPFVASQSPPYEDGSANH